MFHIVTIGDFYESNCQLYFEYVVYFGKIADENAFQWINKGNHSQMYEAQPVGEQAAFTTNMIIPQNSQQVCLQNPKWNHMNYS